MAVTTGDVDGERCTVRWAVLNVPGETVAVDGCADALLVST
jgi:hypothetical protein